jgi:hypothetical protein
MLELITSITENKPESRKRARTWWHVDERSGANVKERRRHKSKVEGNSDKKMEI